MEFRRIDAQTICIDMTVFERTLLASFAEQLLAVLVDEDDPVRVRLLPNAYPDDPDAAAEFRRFTINDLTDHKMVNAQTVLTALEDAALKDVARHTDAKADLRPVLLDSQGVQQWLRTLTDLRLTIANRLGITTDDDEERIDVTDPLLESYHWLGAIQENLVLALER